MDIPLEKVPKQSMDNFMVSLVGAQHQRTLGSRIRPIFITDDNEVKIKPELRKKLLATSGINQDASIVSVRMRK